MTTEKQSAGEPSKLSRRDALLAILLAPSGTVSLLVQEKKDQYGHGVSVLSSKTTLLMELNDADDDTQSYGVIALKVKYKGKTLTFNAAEIWAALEGES